VQREFYEKLRSKEAISIITNDCSELQLAKIVPADAFYPKAVDSAIIILHQKSLLDPSFWSFVRLAYIKRNKDVKNVVKDAPPGLAHKKVHQLAAEEIKELWVLHQKV
jgi:16S rRNA A1518/A1519 N6-dimethyltransferase RsmA/KsgA/DIM1 with predicted DNA glycosylase/AP lyase activity